MKILFCTTVFDDVRNGPAKFARFLLELNEQEDVQIDILTSESGPNIPGVYRFELKQWRWLKPFNFISTMLQLSSRVRHKLASEQYDVVCFNNAVEGWVSSKVNRHTPHIGMINDDNSANASLLRQGFSYLYVRHFIFRQFERASLASYQRIVVNSTFLKNVLSDKYKKSEKLIILPKAIDINVNQFNTLEIHPEREIKILFVKSDFIRGGLEDLLEALNILPYRFVLTIAGPDQERLGAYPHIQARANVRLDVRGGQSQASVFAMLLEHHIFCTPSRMEALGVANMEALIHKIPVVYTEVGGIPEVMNEGSNGFGARAFDPPSLAAAINMCIGDVVAREVKKEAGYTFVKRQFGKTQMLNRFLNLCKAVVDEYKA